MPKSGAGDMLLKARHAQRDARAVSGDLRAPGVIRRADEAIEAATAKLPDGTVNLGAGGELVLVASGLPAEFADTVQRPSYVTADASYDRLALANEAGALEMALDVAETIAPQNSLERMMAHQLAALHNATMKFLARVNTGLAQSGMAGDDERLNAILAHNAAAAACLSGRWQTGLLALHRIRTGGRQTVRVEHVQLTTVQDGGQAIVGGRVTPGRGRRRKRAGVPKK